MGRVVESPSEEQVRRSFARVVVAAALALSACGGVARSTLPAASTLPNFRLDATASELRALHTSDALELKQVAVEALEAMQPASAEEKVPARFLIKVAAEQGTSAGGVACIAGLSITVIGLGLAALCPVHEFTATAELTLEVGLQTLHGTGRASGSTMERGPGPSDQAFLMELWRNLVHNAVQRALIDAVRVPS